MKKIFYFIFLCSLALPFACHKTDTEHPQNAKPKPNTSHSSYAKGDPIDSIVALANSIASVHNSALDYCYERVRFKDISNGATPLGELEVNDLLGFVSEYLTDSLHVQNIDLTDKIFADTIVSSPGSSSISIVDHIYRMSGDTLSPGFRNAINQLNYLVVDSADCRINSLYDTLINRYIYPSTYNNSPTTSLTDDEKTIFATSVYIGKNSIQYWVTNHAKWDTLTDQLLNGYSRMPRNITSRSWIDQVLHDMAEADVTGSIGGGVAALTGFLGTCAGAGTVIFPGIGTVTGGAICGLVAVIGSGIGSSVVAGFWGGVKHLIRVYF